MLFTYQTFVLVASLKCSQLRHTELSKKPREQKGKTTSTTKNSGLSGTMSVLFIKSSIRDSIGQLILWYVIIYHSIIVIET